MLPVIQSEDAAACSVFARSLYLEERLSVTPLAEFEAFKSGIGIKQSQK